MSTKHFILRLTVCICLGFPSLNVRAESWVNLYSENDWFPIFVDIDSDSIRKGRDGLVYFNRKQDAEVTASAINCKKGVYYIINGDTEWRTNGVKIEPGSDYLIEAEYVCSKA